MCIFFNIVTGFRCKISCVEDFCLNIISYCRFPVRSFQTICQPVISHTFKLEARSCVKPSTNLPVLSSSNIKPLYNHESVRTNIKNFETINSWKRIHKYGLEARLRTQGGREVLARRFLRGRRHLAVTDRFMNRTLTKKVKGKRINLFDPKEGYRSMKVKKPEHYRFDNYLNEWRFTRF